MRNLTRNNSGRVRSIVATGLVPLLLLVSVPGCVARHMPAWSKVQSVAPETKTEVQLYGGEQKIKGRFLSATDDSITLRFKDGTIDTSQRSDVRKVLTRRPISKRWPGWAALGAAGILNALFVNSNTGRSENAVPGHLVLQGGITLPIAIGFFFGSRMEGIYEVPPEHRDGYPPETSSLAAGTEKPEQSK